MAFIVFIFHTTFYSKNSKIFQYIDVTNGRGPSLSIKEGKRAFNELDHAFEMVLCVFYSHSFK